MMSDDSDCSSTEIEYDTEDECNSDGAYIDRCESVTRLEISRMVSASGGRIKVAFLEDQELNCWNILQHCLGQVNAVRHEYGDQVSCFKIGVTSDPVVRFGYYLFENFYSMTLLHVSDSHDIINMLEAALVQSYNHIRGCRNINLGGEGPMSSKPPPYFTYIVAARADGRLRIGS